MSEELQESPNETQPEDENVIWKYTKMTAVGIYHVMYNIGGFLADLFGITSPRYPEIVREYNKQLEEERRREMEANGETENENEKVDA